MATRTLSIDIIVNADGSIQKLKTLDEKLAVLSDRSLAKVSAGVSDVDTELRKLQRELDATASKSASLDKTQQSLSGTLIKLAGGLALGAAVKNTLAYADALDDTAKQTGINVVELQKLTFAATQNNVTLTQLTGAFGQLQDRIGSGDKSALKAFERLNLSMAEFKTLSPDKQILAVSDALKGVTDQNERIAILNDLFGRQGRELLPLLTDDLRALMQQAQDTGQVMDESMVKSLANANDNIDAMKGSAMVLLATLLQYSGLVSIFNSVAGSISGLRASIADLWQGATTGWEEFNAAMQRTERRGNAVNPFVPRWWTERNDVSGLPSVTGVGHAALFGAGLGPAPLLPGETPENIAADLNRRRVTARLSRVAEFTAPTSGSGMAGFFTRRTAFDNFDRMPSPAAWAKFMDPALIQGTLANRAGAGSAINLSGMLGPNAGAVLPSGTGTGRTSPFAGLFSGIAQQLPAVIGQALQGGGSVWKSAGALVGSSLGTSVAGSLAKTAFGASGIGKMIGNFIPVIGSLVGPLLGGLMNKIFGGEAKKTQNMRNEFLKSAGGIEELKRKADEAGFSVDRLMNTKKTKDFQKEVEKLNAALELKAVQDARKKFIDAAGGIETLSKNAKLAKVDLTALFNAKTPAAYQAAVQKVTEAMDAWRKRIEALTKAGEALSQRTALIVKQLNEQTITLEQAGQAAQRMGIVTLGVFRALVRETGDLLGSLTAIGPALDDLAAIYKKTGQQASTALAWLLGFREVVRVNADVVGSVQAIGVVLEALRKGGGLTTEMLLALGGDLAALFDQMKAKGIDANYIFAIMQGPLQTLYEIQKKTGAVLDANTQALLDQAKAAGFIGDGFVPDSTMLVGILGDVRDILGDIRDYLLGITDAANDAASAIGGIPAPGSIPGGRSPIPGSIPNMPGAPGYDPTKPNTYPTGPTGPPTGNSYASGGMVYAASGYWARGTDTVPAMLSPGEFVMTRAAVQRMGAARLSAWNRGEGDGGEPPAIHLTYNVSATDGESVRRLVQSREFIDAQQDALRRNHRGALTGTKRVLGLT